MAQFTYDVLSKQGQGLFNQMDADTDKALRQCQDQLKDHETDIFPADLSKEYEQLYANLKKARNDFNVSFSINGDQKKAPKDFDTWRDNLQLLQQGNARFKALIDLEIVANVASLAASLAETAKFGGSKELARLKQEVQKLQAELQDAANKIENQALKTELKLVATEVAALLVTCTTLPVAAIAVGGIAASAMIEYLFSGGSAAKTALSSGKKYVESLKDFETDWEKMQKSTENYTKSVVKFIDKSKKLAKGVGYAKDATDIYFLIQHHKNVKERIRVAEQTMKIIMREGVACAKELEKIKPALDGHYRDVQKAMAIVRDETAKYQTLKAQIAQAQAAEQ
jgi:hypothetical protein